MICLLLLSSILLAPFHSVANAFDDPIGGDGFDPAILMKFTGAAMDCNIDLMTTGMSLMGAVSDTGAIDFGAISGLIDSVLSPLDKPCSASEESIFRDALSDFQTCSGVKLEKLLETWPSASLGEIINCASSSMKIVKSILALTDEDGDFPDDFDATAIPPVVPSDRCIEASFGPNPIGDFGRLLWMHPNVVCDCLGAFSKATPDCTLDEWPIPLVGNWMQKSSCMINKAVCPMLETLCESVLDTLHQCLPHMDVTNNNYDCDAVEKACLQDSLDENGEQTMSSLLSFPQEMTGAPMPDTCQKVANGAQFKDKNLLYRYNKHLNECVTKWEGWADDYVSPKITNTKMMVASTKRGSTGEKVVQSWGGFIGGMAVASVFFIGLGAFLYKRTNGSSIQGFTRGGFNLMNQNDIELS
mmetsp:Transcript_7926/g.12403  ORF Transcript_7926/g.12403 Transcript_7926/m.12403 type:complete len:414 (+) Transcript_7926:123-1364(+)|eukprot:CAMPEP_0194201080 /NCGR_PEP_ID=MMETSP0156-20130528/1448_1 /TAXON_ID=33649 /ORGANISM="Thalassionema nitzschioides, Strain L26-B" /LENGTH=413 /DNA_ID=CAMNT_0038926187 /DNA_START=104 /DNA_END=1345 /DNA_ORIENTATION=+